MAPPAGRKGSVETPKDKDTPKTVSRESEMLQRAGARERIVGLREGPGDDTSPYRKIEVKVVTLYR